VTDYESRRSTTPGPLRNPGFRWFFLGRVVSLGGSSMAPVALAFAVLDSTHSAGALGMILAARSVPMLLFLLIGGVVADRFSRRTVLLVSNFGAALSQGLAAAFFISGNFHLAAIVALEFMNGTLTAFTSPALRGIVPELVDAEQRQRANSLLGSSRNLTSIVGPSLAGGIVIAFGGGWAMCIDALSYLVAAFCLSKVSLPEQVTKVSSAFFRELRDGWVAFRSMTWVCVIVLAFAATNCIYVGVWSVLGPTIASTSVGAVFWGIVLSARAAGMLAATAAMYRVTRARSLVVGLLCFATGAFPMIVLGLRGSAVLLIGVAFVAGVGLGVMAITWETSLQDHVPNKMLSRIAAYDDLVSYAAIPIGQLSVAPLANAFGETQAMVVGGIMFGLIATAPIFSRAVRHPQGPVPASAETR
jgi:MFS family permease